LTSRQSPQASKKEKKNKMKATNNSPAGVKEYAAAILEQYTQPRELLKEWNEANTGISFAEHKQNITHKIYFYFKDAFIFEAGAKPACGNYFCEYEVENLFGLAYTSSGSAFAGLWNNNTRARTRGTLAPLYFEGVALGELHGKYKKLDVIYIFNSEDGDKQYYFTDAEFLKAFEQLQKLENAAALASFRKAINELTPRAVDILKKYDGKKAGEKNREKLRAELATLHQNSKKLNLWAEFSQYSPALVFSYNYNSYNYNKFEQRLYFKFYDAQTNTINTPAEAPAPVKEFDPVEALKTLEAAAEKAKEAAKTCLPYIEAYNEAARILELNPISTNNADIKGLSTVGAAYAARR
jgi:hypothetical protein